MPSHRPKRAGEEFLRHNFNASDGDAHSSKRARFDARNPSTLAADAPDEDPILDLDEIGAKSGQAKRNAVELDGYESDSSNENFDTRAERRAKGQGGGGKKKAKSKDEEDADMFADLADEAEGVESEADEVGGRKKKKEVRFMENEDIEGQVAHSKSGGHVSADFSLNGKGKAALDKDVESSSDESGDDEERDLVGDDEDEQELGAGAKKKHAPKLDAFNMKNEAEEGKFDESGNFIRKAADPFAVHDSWLEDASKSDIRKAKEAQEKRDEAQRQRAIADDAISAGDILAALITRLETSETVLEALARLNSTKDKKKPKWQKNKRKNGTAAEMDVDETEDAAEVKRREAVEAITAAADQLLTRGQTEIYEAERELLMRQYKRETGEEWVDGSLESNGGEKQWEYRWSDARDGGDSHGPYDGPTMVAWNEAGYFGDAVEFREVGQDGWRSSVDFV